jgi:hypothetical protein
MGGRRGPGGRVKGMAPLDFDVHHIRNLPIPVQNIYSVKIFQYQKLSQYGYSSTKYSASKDIPVNTQSVGIFQYKIFNQ